MKESIAIYSLFNSGKIKPLYMYWNKKKIKIERITYTWKTIEDTGVCMHFSIMSGKFYYHIVYDVESSRWYILELEDIIA